MYYLGSINDGQDTIAVFDQTGSVLTISFYDAETAEPIPSLAMAWSASEVTKLQTVLEAHNAIIGDPKGAELIAERCRELLG